MNDTTTWHGDETGTAVVDFPSTATYSQARKRSGWLPSRLPQIALAVLAVTAPIAFYDPLAELRRTGAATHIIGVRDRRRRYITIAQAREIALQILADAERKRALERLEEARLNATQWNDEDFS
jgi:hypothetical protein